MLLSIKMKKLSLSVLLLLLFFITPASSEEKDWVSYCIGNRSHVGKELSVLCNGATTMWPVVCANVVEIKWGLVGLDSAILCSRATSDKPINCYKTARSNRLFGMDGALACTESGAIWIKYAEEHHLN